MSIEGNMKQITDLAAQLKNEEYCTYRNMEEVNGVINRRCAHNCFIGVHPIIDSKYIDNLINSTNGDYFPDWCPLEIEKPTCFYTPSVC